MNFAIYVVAGIFALILGIPACVGAYIFWRGFWEADAPRDPPDQGDAQG